MLNILTELFKGLIEAPFWVQMCFCGIWALVTVLGFVNVARKAPELLAAISVAVICIFPFLVL